MNRVLGTGLLALLAGTGCAVDPSGLGPDRTEADLGTEVDMGMIDPPDARVPPDATAQDMFPPADGFVAVDAFEPPDLCVAETEVCNGMDDDCNGMIDDGLMSEPCDGDADGCVDGMSGCAGGTPTCVDDTPMADDPCDGPDADDEAEGTLSCDSAGLVCTGDCTVSAEVCDRRDNDCDGDADEGNVCSNSGTSCVGLTYAGHIYLFCSEGDGGDDWGGARDECREMIGYELVQIDDAAELAFLQANATDPDGYWTDARADTSDSALWDDTDHWDWNQTGDPVDASFFGTGEPNGSGRCGQLQGSIGYLLDDYDCGDKRQSLCEAAILP